MRCCQVSDQPGGGSGRPLSEEEKVQRLIVAYQEYQAEHDALVQQLSFSRMAAEGLDRAISAVEALTTAEEGQEILVPIGSGSFAYARLASKDRVVLNVGGGVSIEKPVAEAGKSLKARRDEVAEGSRKLAELVAKIEQEMAGIQAALDQIEKQAGSAGVVQ